MKIDRVHARPARHLHAPRLRSLSPARVASHAFGKIDVLFNNCGVGANVDVTLGRPTVMRGTLQANDHDFNFVIDNNVKTAIWVTKHVAPHMPRSESSCIVTSSSVWSRGQHVGAVAYTASKGALSSLTLNWAHEFAPSARSCWSLGRSRHRCLYLTPFRPRKSKIKRLSGELAARRKLQKLFCSWPGVVFSMQQRWCWMGEPLPNSAGVCLAAGNPGSTA